jgi:hypothetical protein
VRARSADAWAVVCFVFAIACTRVWETEVPVWAIVVALLLALVYVIPVGACLSHSPCTRGRLSTRRHDHRCAARRGASARELMSAAVTNFGVGLNVITELIVGYALPGRPVAMMMYVCAASRGVADRSPPIQVQGGPEAPFFFALCLTMPVDVGLHWCYSRYGEQLALVRSTHVASSDVLPVRLQAGALHENPSVRAVPPLRAAR